MAISALIAYCLEKKGAWGDYPFDRETLVIKEGTKMFALFGQRLGLAYVNLKCDPALAGILRQQYPAVTPGYHMNKEHWNTVVFDGSVPAAALKQMADHSYDLVYQSLSKKEKLILSAKA